MEKEEDNWLKKIGPEYALTNEALDLVKDDLEYGISKEDITSYLMKPEGGMKLMSQCFRANMPKSLLAIVTGDGLYPVQARTLLDGWIAGVPEDILLDIAGDKEKAHVMKKKCDGYLLAEKQELKNILSEVKEVLERQRVQERIKEKEPSFESVPKVKPPQQQEYHVVRDEVPENRIIVEYQPRHTRAIVSQVFERMSGTMRKKSAKQLYQLVINRKLTADQIQEVRKGYEQGLTEDQLCDLIHANLPSATMAEIVQIGAMVNRNKEKEERQDE